MEPNQKPPSLKELSREELSTNQPIGKLSEALSKAQSEFPDIKKNCNVDIPLQGGRKLAYSYADLSEILKMLRPVLGKHNLSVAQPIQCREDKTYLTTILAHSSGEFLKSEIRIHQDREGLQGFGAALTYLRRYCLTSMLGISADSDIDGESIQKQGAVARVPNPSTPAPLTKGTSQNYTVSEPQVKRLMAIANKAGWSDSDIKELIKSKFNHDSKMKLNRQQYDIICDIVQTTHPADLHAPPPNDSEM